MKQLAVDILVVGAGPAGLAAAARAAQSGARVGVIDDNPTTGGQIWRGGVRGAPNAQAHLWFGRVGAAPRVTVLSQARVVAPLGDGALLAETPDAAILARFKQLVLATGARERFLPFPGWTLPGVLGAGGLQALVKGGLPIAGKRVVVAGSGPLLLAVAGYLQGKGAQVLLIAEQARWARLALFALNLARSPGKIGQSVRLAWQLRGAPFQASCWIVQAHGGERIEAVTLSQNGRIWTERCDVLACGFGLVPNVELPASLGCAIADGAVQVDDWQRTSRERVYAAGEVTGIGGLELALIEGQIAGLAAAGLMDAARRLFARRAREQGFAAALERAFALRRELKSLAGPDTIVCRCEDVRYDDLERHTSWRAAKLYARCGMGPCQGRICGAATAFLFGWTQDSVRPPVTAARLESLICESETMEHSL
jgi:NADPH-dependent 2,4-dienoyl-CoA reductase/sulfur reductase-like enzyme